jgi:hypothetical protein
MEHHNFDAGLLAALDALLSEKSVTRAGEPAKAQTETPHVARIISSDSIPAGGFTPGTIMADRYRIIGLLGRGGMAFPVTILCFFIGIF